MAKINLLKPLIGAACLSPLVLGSMAWTDVAAQSVGPAQAPTAGSQFDPHGDFPAGGHPRLGPPPAWGSPHLAAHLAEAETEIGIRADQLDAWRDFTDALLAIAEPPRPDVTKSASATADAPKPFALAIELADGAIARAQKAEALKKAVDVLRTKLTQEQLAKAALIEAHLPPHFEPQGRPPLPHFAPPPPELADGCRPDGFPPPKF